MLVCEIAHALHEQENLHCVLAYALEVDTSQLLTDSISTRSGFNLLVM